MNHSATLASGIPTHAHYRALLESSDFRDLESFSNEFLARNRSALRAYSRRWSSDPLHHWSRQWEYPYVWRRLEAMGYTPPGATVRILDAGSGVTFFPFFLAARFPQVEVVCLDCDKRLERIHARIVEAARSRTRFKMGGIQRIDEPDASFDAIYCISVLEHTEDYEQVIHEFRRILKPGGKLIATFDISLDGAAQVPVDVAEALLGLLKAHFNAEEPCPAVRDSISKDSVTTTFIRDTGLATRPWRHPWLSAMRSLLQGKPPKRLFKDLTFYCGTFNRP